MADAPQSPAEPGTQKINWDDSKMTTTFANVVNGTSSREEVTLFFGTNKSWNVPPGGDVTIELSDRIILTPFAGKRLLALLSALIKQYEERYGVLDIAPPTTTTTPPSAG